MKAARALTAAIILLLLLPAARLQAQWPQRNLTLVTSLPAVLPWEVRNPQQALLEALVADLARELGTGVHLDFRPGGFGALAVNRVVLGKSDGYSLGLIGADPAMTRVIQGYTPYEWEEVRPVAAAWREVKALVTPADLSWEDLAQLARLRGQGPPRLAHLTPPPHTGELLALEAASQAGFTWERVIVDRLDPALLLDGRAEAMVVPLGWLATHPRAGELNVALVFSDNDHLPCLQGRPTLIDRGLKLTSNPPAAFYLPAKVNSGISLTINQALNKVLARNDALIAQNCLEIISTDLEESKQFIDDQYLKQEAVLKLYRFIDDP